MLDNQSQNNLDPIKQMPEYVQDAMCSPDNAEINGKIAEKYQLTEDDTPLMVNIIARVILKEISLMDFPRALKDALNLDVETTKAMALDISIRRFLPLKNHLGDVENLIRKLGGEVPSYAKALENKPAPPPPPPPPPPPSFLHKDLRTILKDNKDAEEQLITSQPIRVEGFNGLVRPSLKNWLSDYIRLEGVGPHSLMTLTSYLYNSTNGKALGPKERKILGKILQSYSENISLPVSEKTGLIVLEELEKEAMGAPPAPTTSSYDKDAEDKPSYNKTSEGKTSFVPQSRTLEGKPSYAKALEDSPRPLKNSPPIVAEEQLRRQIFEYPSTPTNQSFFPNVEEKPLQQPSMSPPRPTPSPAPLQKESGPPPPIREDSYLEPISDLESGSSLPKTESRSGQPGAQPRPAEQLRDSTGPRREGNIVDLKNFRQS
jgi:hypothetical protein